MLLPKTSSAFGPAVGAERVEQLVRRAPLAGQRLRVARPTRRRRARGRPGRRSSGSRAAGRPSARARGRPGRCPGRSGSRSRAYVAPGRPSASATLIQASTVSVPWACCSAPRAVSTIDPVGPGQQVGQRAQLVDGHAGDPLDPLGPPGRDGAAYVVEAGGARGDVLLVDARRRRPSRCRTPEGEGEVGAGHRLEEQVGAVRGRRAPRVDHDHPCRRARAAGRGGGPPAASSRRGWTRPAPPRRSARRRRAGTAARGRSRRRGCRPRRPTTCTSGRCSRSGWCPARPARTCRAGRPSRWSARRRRRPPPRPGRAAARSVAQPARDQVERLVPATPAAARRWPGRAAAAW